MKLVVGMGTIDDYMDLARAGADEVFCGYIPAQWNQQFGDQYPMNRREVLFPNVQIGSESELVILAQMQEDIQVPVTLTLNAPSYQEQTLSFLSEYVKRCSAMGFQDFIIADERLLEELNSMSGNKDKIKIHLSGEYGELNHLVLDALQQYNQIKRIIFPRQTSIEEMKNLISYSKKHAMGKIQAMGEEVSTSTSYEAFFQNEKCHFTGAYCNSVHSDFFCHLCQIPYIVEGMKKVSWDRMEDNVHIADDLHMADNAHMANDAHMAGDQHMEDNSYEESYCESEISNSSGCGFCALWKLRDAGVTHLKIVSRGNFAEDTIKDVKRARTALRILEEASSEEEYISEMKKCLFPHGCSGNCYYLE